MRGRKRHLRFPCGAGAYSLRVADVRYVLDFNPRQLVLYAGRGTFTETGQAAALLYGAQALVGWYASPTGSATGDGSYSDPWDFATAFAGGPTGDEIQPGDTIWLRRGTYTFPACLHTVTDAAMADTPPGECVTLTSVTGGFKPGGVPIYDGYWITVSGAGDGGATLSTTVYQTPSTNQITLSAPNSSGGPISNATAKVWYTAFKCGMNGTVDAPITFRSYPHEWAVIDTNYAQTPDYPIPTEGGNSIDGVQLLEASSHVFLRNIEIMNSNTNRFRWPDYSHARGGITIGGYRTGILNCYTHDGAGLGSFTDGVENTIYGNVNLHQGSFRYFTPNGVIEAAIDLAPAGGSAVALSGSCTTGKATTGSGTWSHNHTGDCLVVVMSQGGSPRDFNSFTVTQHNGSTEVPLNRIVGNNGGNSWNNTSVAVFTLTNAQGATTGSHNITINSSSAGRPLRGIAQSVSNVDQANPATPKGTYTVPVMSGVLAPYINTAASAANHMVLDVWYLGAPAAGTQPYGDNEGNAPPYGLVYRGSCGTGDQQIAMTCAPGASSVAMGWTMDYSIAGHSHSLYTQSFRSCMTLVTAAGDTTVTTPSANTFRTFDAGATIVLEGAKADTTDLYTTIVTVNSGTSIDVAEAPGRALAAAQGFWATGKTVFDNIFYDGIGLCTIQAYGSSDASYIGGHIAGNFLAFKLFAIGGLSGFHLNDTLVENNYCWQANADPGYRSAHTDGLTFRNNYIAAKTSFHTDQGKQLSMTDNTFIGEIENFTQAEFPDNDYMHVPPAPPPTTNLVVIRPNIYKDDYDPWFGRIYVYNWENLPSVNVDLSSMVPVGTAIEIRNGQNLHGTAVWTDTYTGGTVSIPMDALTVKAAVGAPWEIPPSGTTGPGCGAFVVCEAGWGS